MTKYLDLSGLSYFWSKIVDKLNLKANILRTKLGQNNEDDPNDNYLLMIGNGPDSANKKTVFSVDNNGDAKMSDLEIVADSNDMAEVRFATDYNNHPIMKFYGAQDAYGDAMVLGGGGAVVIGGGESADYIYNNVVSNPGDERTYIAGDIGVDFYTNCNNPTDKELAYLNQYGDLHLVQKTSQRGTTPQSNCYKRLQFVDKDLTLLASVESALKNNGRNSLQLWVLGNVSGSNSYSGIEIYKDVNNTNNASIEVNANTGSMNIPGTLKVQNVDVRSASLFNAGTLPKARGGTGITDLGDIKSVWGSDVNIASGATGTLCSLSIPAGRWVVVGAAVHPGGGSGWYFAINVTTGSTVSGRGAIRVNNQSGSVYLVDTCILNLSSATTYKLVASHNQGSTKACAGSIYAIKIG